MAFKLQYVSNLFLDLHKRTEYKNIIRPVCDNLVLLGNTCRIDTYENRDLMCSFLNYIEKNWKQSYIVPGPWELSSIKKEYYSSIMSDLALINKDYPSITVLNNSSINIKNTDIQLVGSMLWTRTPYIKHQCFYEFSSIYETNQKTISGNNIIHWHLEDLEYIKTVAKYPYRSIVLTHHIPFILPQVTFQEQQMIANNSEKIMKKPIEIWLCGAGSKTFTGNFGYSRDVFGGVNPYTTFNTFKKVNENYDPEAYISLRNNNPQLA